MNIIMPQKQVIAQPHDELILVVKRTHLLPGDGFQGLKTIDCDTYLQTIQAHKKFLPRSIMETDPTYKQIIPYLLFKHNNSFFLMQRRHNASEARLQNKFTLGIGGHIREKDIQSDSIVAWAQREFNEEVHYAGNLKITPLGILNDDSNDVGKVHIGFVFLLEGDSGDIRIKSELKWGELTTLDACKKYTDHMESWSSLVLPYL